MISKRWLFFGCSSPPKSSFFGASVAGSLPLKGEWLHLRGDLSGAWTAKSDPLGDVSGSLYLGGLSVLASTHGAPAFLLGPHLELGYAWASGTARVPDVVGYRDGRVVALASVIGGARVALGRRWAGMIETDWGLTIHGFNALSDGQEAVVLRGAFAAIRAGMAWQD